MAGVSSSVNFRYKVSRTVNFRSSNTANQSKQFSQPKLAEQSTKVSSSEDTQKKKETISKEKRKIPPKKQHYFFDNILLTEEEYKKLVEKLSILSWRVEELEKDTKARRRRKNKESL